MNDPLAPVLHPDMKTQAALRAQQEKDRAAGNAVERPAGYRIATTEERREFVKAAKALEVGKKWDGRGLRDGAVLYGPFGHWWVKE